MLRPARRLFVVFTQGFPVLEEFARLRFLPSNPLSSSCIWFDEDDFRTGEAYARRYGCTNPLRIDPYAHHPQLSRFAAGQRLGPRGVAREAGADSIAETPLQTSDAADSGAVGRDAASVAPAAYRARGRSLSRSAAEHEHRAASGAGLQCYRVPICTLAIPRPIYLLNKDQMWMPNTATTDFLAQLAGAPGDWSAGSDTLDWCAKHMQTCSLNADPYVLSWKGRSTPAMYDEKLWPNASQDQRIAEGVRALQRHFPESVDHGCHTSAALPMLSIWTRQAYSDARQTMLRAYAHLNRYHSRWWGTVAQWRRAGALMQPGQVEHKLHQLVNSKLVHISLIEDGAAVLRQLTIFAKRRSIMFHPPAMGRDDHDGGVMQGWPDQLAQGIAWGASATPAASRSARPHSELSLISAVMEDTRIYQRRLPVYLSARQLRDLGLTLRTDAVGVNTRWRGRAQGTWFTAGGVDAVGAGSAPVVPDSTRTSDTTAAVEAGDPAMHRKDLVPPPHAAASPDAAWRSSAPASQFWYHLSQVHFPDSYLVPSAVLAAELESPGVPLHGVSGRPLRIPALTYGALVNEHPEVAAAVRGEAATSCAVSPPPADPTAAATTAATPPDTAAAIDTGEVAIARFVAAKASPKCVQGRSLWYRADDVLAVGGIVDVNQAPVEVMEGNVATDEVERPQFTLYNVECVTDPERALYLLCLPSELS
ncbi:hypothetical protein NESM_000344400 [Novymonas esmeraldas]|uniref:Trypanosoma Tc-38 (p38) protein domain-containing protein n=1 Tax=Novymonas esmeraldas TaxID=1808958 RepID=A0AAW0EMA9_9TRYP